MNKHVDELVLLLKQQVFWEELSAEDKAALQVWADEEPENQEMLDWLSDSSRFKESLSEMEMIRARVPAAIKRFDLATREDQKGNVSRPMFWFLVAAASIAALSYGAFLFWKTTHVKLPVHPPIEFAAIQPAKDRAILTLGDGRKVNLDSAGKGAVFQQGAVQAIKQDSGQLSYVNTTGVIPTGIIYNTLTTPRGGKYTLVLPDGSKVWLNNASSLTYPTAFAGGKREVTLTGEGYFEVKHLQSVPFTVFSRAGNIQDIGTHFNVMAFENEPVTKTTLEEGAISVTVADKTISLKPGQQAQRDDHNSLLVKDAKVEQETSWLHNEFVFSDADLYSVMRQISRWYDVEVIYKGKVPNRLLSGSAPRNTQLSTILQLLSVINVHASIEGRTVIVEP